MNESTPPPAAPEPAPFGAGVPHEAIEPVRLAPGLAHGPALDVSGTSSLAQPAATGAPALASAPGPQASGAAVPPGPPFHAQTSAPATTDATPTFAGSPSPARAAGIPNGNAAPHVAANAPGGPIPPAAGPGPAPQPAPAQPRRRWWVALAHLFFLIPFPPGVILTAALWIWRRARDPLLADQGREALNMQLTFWLAIWILGATCLGTPLVPFAYVLGAVLCVLAAIAGSGGDRHRYPWVFRFIA